MRNTKGRTRFVNNGFLASRISVSLVLSCLFISCSSNKSVYLPVLVKDQESKQGIGEVQIKLFKYFKGGEPQLLDTFLTHPEGELEVIEFVAEKGYLYKISANKPFYKAALAGNGASLANEAKVEFAGQEADTLTLYLNSLRRGNMNTTSKRRASTNVNELIGKLKAGSWEGNSLPRLNWGDIPALLDVGGDSTVILNFPIKTGSTLKPDSARLGQVALWMVEAIRRDASKKGTDKPVFLMPPSNVPVLGTRRGNPRLFNSKNALNRAHQSYIKWWEGRSEGDTLRTARRNPLRGTGLGWM